MSEIPKYIFCCAAVACLPALSGDTLSAPLFDDEELLSVIIEAPIRTLVAQRKTEGEYAGTLRYTDASGEQQSVAIVLKPRGNSRLEMCNYPPLKISFDPQETTDTLFADQRSLKLVTQCMRDRAADDWLYLELGAYRAFSLITPNSYRTRELVVTYRDTESNGRERVQPAFFVEADHQVEERLGLRRIRPPQVDPAQLSSTQTTYTMLFQYLIGNTDFAVKRGSSGEGCCHNGRVFARDGAQRDYVIVPFDFDQTGIVNTDYAQADERLGIRRVTQRLYRGFCWQNEELTDAISLFNANRAGIEAAFRPSGISKRQARRVQRFIDGFYNTVNDSEELQKRLLDKCRGPDSLPMWESPVSPVHIKKASASRP